MFYVLICVLPKRPLEGSAFGYADFPLKGARSVLELQRNQLGGDLLKITKVIFVISLTFIGDLNVRENECSSLT
jgi:hypothetical protein